MLKFLKMAVFAALAALPVTAQAVTITSYDITNTLPSGFGLWSHIYTGTITPAAPGFNYAGGSGTLNDGNNGINAIINHLFQTDYLPTIALHLEGFYTITNLSFLSDFTSGNLIPGNLSGVDVTIGGQTQTVILTGFGPSTGFYPVNDLATLNTTLSAIATDSVLLSNFVTDGSSGIADFFGIGEITLSGTAVMVAPGVPEPSTWAMMIIGFGAVGGAVRRSKARTTFTFA